MNSLLCQVNSHFHLNFFRIYFIYFIIKLILKLQLFDMHYNLDKKISDLSNDVAMIQYIVYARNIVQLGAQ